MGAFLQKISGLMGLGAHDAEPAVALDQDTDLQQSVLSMIRRIQDKGRQNRKAEVWHALTQRLYNRGDQNLSWDAGADSIRLSYDLEEGEEDSNYKVFNVIQGYGKSFIATFTQGRPKVRPEPESNPFDPDQIAAARKADKYRRVFEKDNDIQALTQEMGRLLWTDSRVISETYSDGEKEVVKLWGALESRVLITATVDKDNPLAEVPLVQLEREQHKCFLKSKYPDAKVSASSSSANSYERDARLAVMTLKPSEDVGGIIRADSDGMVTVTRSYLRPELFTELSASDQASMEEQFPHGVCIVHNDTVYLESWAVDFDGCLDAVLPLPGDGLSRPSIGSPAMALQDSVNEFGNLIEETFERGLGRTWIDVELLGTDELKKQDSAPGNVVRGIKERGQSMESHIFPEPGVNPSAQLLEFFENTRGPMMQFSTGQQPGVYGAAMQDEKTATVYMSAQNRALGLFGIVWKPYTGWYARTVTKAINLAWQNRTQDVVATLSGSHPGMQERPVRIAPQSLQGAKFVVEGDDNFAQSWSEKRQNYQALVNLAKEIPELGAILMQPDNMALGRNLWGLDDLVLPQADSRNKQLQEIAQLEDDPASVSLGKYDDDATEFAECVRWLNSAEGLAAKIQSPDWYMAVEAHADQHDARIQAKQPQPQQDKPKVLINYKDLPGDGQVQAAGEAGITLNPAGVAQKQAQEAPQPPIAA